MEALLIEEWLRGLEGSGPTAPVLILDEPSLSVVRERSRSIGADAGVATEVIERACLVATEMGMNQLRHARAGRIAVRAITRRPDASDARSSSQTAAPPMHIGLELAAVDRGLGIRDIAAALDASPRVSGTLGVGVGSIRRLSSDVDVDIRLGEGTRIVARVLPREAPRHREVGVYGRPFPGETVNGDHASYSRRRQDGGVGGGTDDGDSLIVAICDGLGHGPPAREAAVEAMRVFDEQSVTSSSPAAILEACHSALAATRGVVMAVVRTLEKNEAAARASASLELCSAGNIDLQICAPRKARRFGGSSAIVGGRGNMLPKLRSETTSFEPGEVLIMTTDGISSKVALEEDLAILREHPIVIAQRIMERWSRTTDDALVLVVR